MGYSGFSLAKPSGPRRRVSTSGRVGGEHQTIRSRFPTNDTVSLVEMHALAADRATPRFRRHISVPFYCNVISSPICQVGASLLLAVAR